MPRFGFKANKFDSINFLGLNKVIILAGRKLLEIRGSSENFFFEAKITFRNFLGLVYQQTTYSVTSFC